MPTHSASPRSINPRFELKIFLKGLLRDMSFNATFLDYTMHTQKLAFLLIACYNGDLLERSFQTF